jgi:hypothetical protein
MPMSTNRRWACLVVTVFIVIGLLACDPGVILQPVNWKNVRNLEWRSDIDGVEIRTGALGGLIGETWAAPEFRVTNRTDQRVVFEAAELTSKGRTYTGAFAGDGEERWRSAEPGTTACITISWDFNEPIGEVYGDGAVITLRLRVGERVKVVDIRYERGGFLDDKGKKQG